MEVGNKLNPQRSYRQAFALKGKTTYHRNKQPLYNRS